MTTTVTVTDTETITEAVNSYCDITMRQCQSQQIGCIWQGYGDIIETQTYDATGISSPANLIITSSPANMIHYPWCRHGNFLYYTHADGAGGGWVDEYNLSTNEINSLQYYNGTETSAGNGASLAYLEDRKLVITDSNTAYGDDSLSWIWYVDFDASTVTEKLEVEWYYPTEDDEQLIEKLCVVKDMTGDLHIIAMGQYWLYNGGDGQYGTSIWHCNYTDAPNTFTRYDKDAPDSAYPSWAWTGVQHGYDIVSDDYVVVYSGVQFATGDSLHEDSCVATVFNINTNAIDSYLVGYGYLSYPAEVYFHSVDRTNNKTYIFMWHDEYDQSPGPYYMRMWEFNPSTGSSSVIYQYEMTSYSWFWTFESSTHAYFYNLENSTLYQSSNQSSKGTFTLPQDQNLSHNLLCSVIEDGSVYGELLWYLSGTDLKAVELDGTNRVNLDLSASYTPLNHMELLHLGDSMMIIAYKDTPTTKYDFYLVS